jgi:hypothetical protein
MSKSIYYYGRRDHAPIKRYRKLTDTGDLDHSTCYLHGGKYERATCPGCVESWESEQDFAALLEALDGDF